MIIKTTIQKYSKGSEMNREVRIVKSPNAGGTEEYSPFVNNLVFSITLANGLTITNPEQFQDLDYEEVEYEGIDD